MATKKKGLGRGLDLLIDQADVLGIDGTETVEQIEIEDIVANPYQPRKFFDEAALDELAASIKENGVFQPIIIRSSVIGYELIAGERRLRASKLAGLTTIPAIVKAYTDEQMMELALIENIQREDLSVIEEAKSYQQIIEHFNYTQQELAQKVGKSRSHVTNILRLLNLDERVQALVNQKIVSMGHVKVLVTLDSKDEQLAIVEQIIEENLTVRQTEELASALKNPHKASKVKASSKSDEKKELNAYARLERILREKLGTKVKIYGKETGIIEISFASEDDLERLLEEMKLV